MKWGEKGVGRRRSCGGVRKYISGEKIEAQEDEPDSMPRAHSVAYLFCEKERSCMKTSKKEKNREFFFLPVPCALEAQTVINPFV